MRDSLRACVLIVVFAFYAGHVSAADDKARPVEPKVRLGELLHIDLAPRKTPPTSPERINRLIASLASLGKPDVGLSETLSGSSFAPVPDLAKADTMLLTDHQLNTSDALKELVSIGPDALPFLLDALNDQTPTKITTERKNQIGGTWFDREVDTNPVNRFEKGVLPSIDGRGDSTEKLEYIDFYTLKVGDVCFVIIGQIVGRAYEAIRYQPTASIVINSPTHDPVLCAEVRKFWSSASPRQKLFDSLRADYATIGIFNGQDLDGWYDGSEFQCYAATRLLYYFSEESAASIAARIDHLDLSKDADGNAFMKRCIANGVRSDDFFNAVAWSPDQKVRAALRSAFRRAGDVDSLLAASSAEDDKAMLADRFSAAINAFGDQIGEGNIGGVFSTLAKRAPDLAKPIFLQQIKTNSTDRCAYVCEALRGIVVPWDIELLRPMLSDARTIGGSYVVVEGTNEPRQPIRMCDEAAGVLAQNHPNLKFKLTGTHAALDQQIVVMQKTLSATTRP